MSSVTYCLEPDLTPEEFIDVLVSSTLAERRPINKLDSMEEAELIWHDSEFACDVTLQHTFLGYSTFWSPDHDAAEVAVHCAQMASQAMAGPSWLANPDPKAECQLLRCVVATPSAQSPSTPPGCHDRG